MEWSGFEPSKASPLMRNDLAERCKASGFDGDGWSLAAICDKLISQYLESSTPEDVLGLPAIPADKSGSEGPLPPTGLSKEEADGPSTPNSWVCIACYAHTKYMCRNMRPDSAQSPRPPLWNIVFVGCKKISKCESESAELQNQCSRVCQDLQAFYVIAWDSKPCRCLFSSCQSILGRTCWPLKDFLLDYSYDLFSSRAVFFTFTAQECAT